MKTFKRISIESAWAVSLCLLFALGATRSWAQQVISYQGMVTQNSTQLSGTHTVEVSIYTTATGGTAIYTETQSLPFTAGIFNDLIGSVTPLPAFASGNQYFVGVSIDGGTELTPRSQLGAAPMVVGGTVNKLNSLNGAVTLAGGGGTTINQSGQTITISSSGGGGTGIQGIQNTDGTINITSPNGPTATIGLADNAVTTAKLAVGAVTTSKIANGAVTNALVGSSPATNGQVLTANGTGGAAWITPAAFSLPYSQSLSSASTLFSITNTGTGTGITGSTASGIDGNAGVVGTTSSLAIDGVLGLAADGANTIAHSGVCGSSAGGYGVSGATTTGYGLYGISGTTGIAVVGLAGFNTTTGQAGLFENDNPATTGNVLEAKCLGTGEAGFFHIDNPASTANTLDVRNSGTGYAINASAGGEVVIQGQATSVLGIGVVGRASDGSTLLVPSGVCGTSDASIGTVGTTVTGYGVEGYATTSGVGIYGTTGSSAVTARAALFALTNSAATANAVEVNNAGTGSAIKAVSTSLTSIAPAILAQNGSTASYAYGIQGEITSTTPGLYSAAIRGINDGTSGNGIGVWGSQAGGGYGVYGTAVSGFGVYGTAVSGQGVYASTVSGQGLFGESTGAGTGVYAKAASSGTCNALIANMLGSTTSTTTSNNCAIFQSAGSNVARIDRTGKGYFDGGTVTSGADIAEEFDVAGARSGYSPGDVLVISTTGDRQVEKCSMPYSRLVVGVYATKPGVTLSDMGIDSDESARVPMGVIGVIPTKVTAEGGPITAGDLLVTSSTSGCAMKADLNKLQIGEALGKALENFSGPGIGVVKVLVGKY